MIKTKPLWQRLYEDECYQEVCRAVGYFGCTWRELTETIERLAPRFGKSRVESATWHLTLFEGQMTVTPKPLAKVDLRVEVRKVCHQLLGPTPDSWDQFYRNADGTPGPQHEEKMAELERRTGKKPEPPKRSAKRAAKK